MFLVGVRNIPRRRAQTILIIIGLMLSTLIISTAFSIGDTVDYSITNQVYDSLHSVDEIVQAKTNDDDERRRSTPAARSSRRCRSRRRRRTRSSTQFRAVDGVDGASP